MVTPASTRILTLVLALTATTAFADDFMLGPGRIMSDPVRPSADCDNNPAEPAASSGATVSTAADTPDAAPATPRLPSAEPAVPQKPRNGLRWQSVLPGSIK